MKYFQHDACFYDACQLYIFITVSCELDEFQCSNGYGCTDADKVCDGYGHCLHGSEEEECR